MLTVYLDATTALLQNPPAPSSLYSTSQLTSFINTARGQLAGDGECIRTIATLALTAGTQTYDFSAITLPATMAGVLNIRIMGYQLGTGQKWIRPRPWEWFNQYYLNNAAPVEGPPEAWAQYGQGSSGSFYVGPPPDQPYTLMLDCTCYPIPLVDDTTDEAIPYPWTDCVPFFAAWYALLSAQSAARQNDADRMFQRYQDFLNRARRSSTPSVLPGNYEQAPNLFLPQQLGVASGGGGR